MKTNDTRTIRSTAAALLGLASLAALPSCGGGDTRALNSITEAEKSAGWTLLFDGQSVANFRGYKLYDFPDKGWAVYDGCLCRVSGVEGAGDIVTREQFSDFEFICEWRVPKGGNSGIIYRCTEDHGAPYETGPEYQILDDAAHADGATAKTRAGSMYDIAPVSQGVVHSAGNWNEARIVAEGPRIRHWLNGELVVDVNLQSEAFKEARANSKWAKTPDFATRDRGHIALQDHGDGVCFRNIRVRRLN